MRIVIEEPCEMCGEVYTADREKPHLMPKPGSNYAWSDCPGSGGSRRILPEGSIVIEGEITQERYFNDAEFATLVRRIWDVFDKVEL